MIFQRCIFVAFFWTLLFSLCSAKSIIPITKDTIDKFNDPNLSLVLYYTSWCGYCKDLHPKYKAAAEILASHEYNLYEINCENDQELCRDHQIAGYPTIKAFEKGKFIKDYPNDHKRETDAIVDFVLRHNRTPYSKIDTEDALSEFLSTKPKSSVLAIIPEDHPDKEALIDKFRAISRDYSHLAKFHLTHLSGSKHLSNYDNDISHLLVTDDVKALKLDHSTDDLIPHVIRAHLPPFGGIDESNYELYLSAKLPIAFLFVTPEQSKEYSSIMAEVANRFPSLISFVWIDSTLYDKHAHTLGLSGKKFPCFAIHDMDNGLKFPYDESSELDVKHISEFVEGVINKQIKPYFRSEPIPTVEEDLGPVHKLVHDDLGKILHEKHASLVKFYAPWCNACNRLAPNYISLATSFSDQKDKIKFYEFDLENNDIPIEIENSIKMIPALYLYQPESSSFGEFIKFEGDPYKVNIASFLVSNCKNGLEAVQVESDDVIQRHPTGTGTEPEDHISEDEGYVSHDDL